VPLSVRSDGKSDNFQQALNGPVLYNRPLKKAALSSRPLLFWRAIELLPIHSMA